MTIAHHPSDESVLAYANGSLSAALGLAVAAHADGCDVCRQTVGLVENMGGVFLESAPPMALPAGALADVLARLETPGIQPRIPPVPQPDDAILLPPALRHLNVGARRWLAPGIWTRPILKDPAHGTRLYLLGAGAGKSLPRHGHHGIEMTQVLQGEFFDDGIRFGRGDFLEADGGHEHRLMVGANGDCVCVIASEGLPRGLVGFLMRAFT